LLSKSDFLLFLDSPMHLWAKAHDALESKAHTPYEQHLIQQGQAVEALARQYLEKFLLPQYNHAQIIWQPTFDDGNFQIRADALILDLDADVYDLYEIKSSTSVHTDHEFDITFQTLLLEATLAIRHSNILHIDKSYEHGESLDLARFFTVEEVSDKIGKRRESVQQLRQAALTVTQMNKPDSAWACTKPKTCPCPELCHPHLPTRSIYDLPRIGKKALELREMGITAVDDIPTAFPLNKIQSKHARAFRTGEAVIDREAIRASLGELKFPLYFLDYETFNPAVPLFQGYQPYEHIVFQYSLHKLTNPDAEFEHTECLILDKEEPAPRLISQLLKDIGPTGSVIVWYKNAESGWNKGLARHCPQYAERLLGINERLYDLMEIFSKGYYVHPDFHGSASLKAVLPVLCPELAYTDLEIANGEAAMLTWYWLQQAEVTPEEMAEIDSNLRAYCQRDTYGMVAIWNYLRTL
jgi:hypothetical protein